MLPFSLSGRFFFFRQKVTHISSPKVSRSPASFLDAFWSNINDLEKSYLGDHIDSGPKKRFHDTRNATEKIPQNSGVKRHHSSWKCPDFPLKPWNDKQEIQDILCLHIFFAENGTFQPWNHDQSLGFAPARTVLLAASLVPLGVSVTHPAPPLFRSEAWVLVVAGN